MSHPPETSTPVRSPCIGVCSTTYGDLVCRGCKRFAHEVVGWNTYRGDQKAAVWSRLLRLRAGSAAGSFSITNIERLAAVAEAYRIPDREVLDAVNLAFEVLRRLAAAGIPLSEAGLASDQHAGALVSQIDREFHTRSVAAYEHHFKQPVNGG